MSHGHPSSRLYASTQRSVPGAFGRDSTPYRPDAVPRRNNHFNKLFYCTNVSFDRLNEPLSRKEHILQSTLIKGSFYNDFVRPKDFLLHVQIYRI